MIQSTSYWRKLQVSFYNLHFLCVLNIAAGSSFQSHKLFKMGPNCGSPVLLHMIQCLRYINIHNVSRVLSFAVFTVDVLTDLTV
jgi:hypothetical protein